jgi:hypothetical protein
MNPPRAHTNKDGQVERGRERKKEFRIDHEKMQMIDCYSIFG